MASNGTHSNEPRPRLCHLRRWPNFIGYGFNLHCEKTKPGQYIGKVDPNSPAESAGLKENDRIIEVNYVPIGNENHKQVVSRIKEGVTRNNTKYPEEVILLVLDPEADEFFKSKGIVVRSHDSNVEKRETEIRRGTDSSDGSPQLSNRSIGKVDSPSSRELSSGNRHADSNLNYKHVTDFTGPTVTQTKSNESPVHPRTYDTDYDNAEFHRPSPTPSNTDKRHSQPATNGNRNHRDSSPQVTHLPPTNSNGNTPASSSQVSPASQGSTTATLELKMSAAEYRQKLKAEGARKRDPRQDQKLSMKQKHDLIDQL